MDLLKLMGNRYTCRRYSNEDVKEEVLYAQKLFNS